MPVHCPITIRRLSPAEFEGIDYRVMGHAYSSQNDLGRLCDECAYQADLKARLLADGVESNLRRLLALTNLNAIQWINLNHSRIEFTTVARNAEPERINGHSAFASNSFAVHSSALNQSSDLKR